MKRAWVGWFAVARSQDLGRRILPISLDGERYVLFRNRQGQAVFMNGHCPHRQAPLALGRVRDGTIECPYHGWRFDAEGRLAEIPGVPAHSCPSVRLRTYPSLEAQGLIFVSLDPAAPKPDLETLFQFPGLHRVSTVVDYPAPLEWTLENLSDFSHVPCAHRKFGGNRRIPSVPVQTTAQRRAPDGTTILSSAFTLEDRGFTGKPFPIEASVLYQEPATIRVRLSPHRAWVVEFLFFLLPLSAEKTRVFAVTGRSFFRWRILDALVNLGVRRLLKDDIQIAAESRFDQNIAVSHGNDWMGLQIRRMIHRRKSEMGQ